MIGLGTYAFFWQQSAAAPKPLSLVRAFEATRELGLELFQICDFEPLAAMDDVELADTASAARDLGVRIELGTKGLEPEQLSRFLTLAETFGATLVRSMIHSEESKPTLQLAEQWLHTSLPAYESSGVTLALETYEQVSTSDLVMLIERVGSENLGICLDPGNVVARLEHPRECIDLASPYVKNIHVKDFAFTRQPDWVGFVFGGAPMGKGLHDYHHLLDAVNPRDRDINEIVEHWISWQGNVETTIRTERAWTRATIEYLRRTL